MRHLAVVLLCFVLSAAAFLGATFYADARLGRVVRLTHDVTDNAMPSLAEVGVMQRALAHIQYTLDARKDGQELDSAALDADMRELQEARHRYESHPQFEGEPEIWAPARPVLDALPTLVTAITSDADVGLLASAERRLNGEFAPAETIVRRALVGVHRVNLEQGTRAARGADSAWRRVRAVTFALAFACTMLTAALAMLALWTARHLVASEARRANELDAFASRVAHDIRGPLTLPLFALERLGQELGDDFPRRPLIDKGIRGLQRTESLVNDLLTFARAAAAPSEEASTSLREGIAGVLQDFERDAACARVQLEVEEMPDTIVRCSPGVVASIVGNLVGNAIKFMPAEATDRAVSIRARAEGERVVVEVQDTGAGVSEQQRARIFEPYVRGDPTRPGLGLGLATAKRLVMAHGGRIGLRSRAGGGTVFWFELPCSVGTAKPERIRSWRGRMPDCRGVAARVRRALGRACRAATRARTASTGSRECRPRPRRAADRAFPRGG